MINLCALINSSCGDIDVCESSSQRVPRVRMWSSIFLHLTLFGSLCVSEKIRYISTEHPQVTYYNPKYVSYANLTAQRYGRNDPFYYVGFHVYFLEPIYNNISVDFYFFEWLTNRYKRGFIEMHWKMCDLIHKDNFFGSAMKQGKFDQPCPFPAGAYNLYNMTIPIKQIPYNFPFQKGRIYANLTSVDNKDLVGSGFIDMEIKEAYIRSSKPKI